MHRVSAGGHLLSRGTESYFWQREPLFKVEGVAVDPSTYRSKLFPSRPSYWAMLAFSSLEDCLR